MRADLQVGLCQILSFKQRIENRKELVQLLTTVLVVHLQSESERQIVKHIKSFLFAPHRHTFKQLMFCSEKLVVGHVVDELTNAERVH